MRGHCEHELNALLDISESKLDPSCSTQNSFSTAGFLEVSLCGEHIYEGKMQFGIVRQS